MAMSLPSRFTKLFFFYFLCPLLVMAQITSQSGAISGAVTDQSGASIPNAKVTLSSPKGTTTTQNASGSGEFTFPLLDPGVYSVTVEATGFNKTSFSNITVEVTQITKIPVKLEIGSSVMQVEVADTAVLVNSTNASLGNTLSGETVQNLPLATRNFTNLLALNAATASALPNAAAAGRGSMTVFVNGQRGTNNNLVINGIDANNVSSNNFSNVATPSPDTIEEFRVQTSLYDASQGKTSGGNINVILKGGSPQYHGEAYEYFRNNDLNANSFFFNRTGTPRPILKQNQFGGNFGGPVPKLKRTFFFGSYQGTRQVNGLSGAISSLFPVLPTQRTAANIASAFGIPQSSLDPVAINLLNAKGSYGGYLIPSGTGTPGTLGNITVSAPLRFTDDQFNANADHIINDANRISLRLFRDVGSTFDPLGGQGASSLGSGLTTPGNNLLSSISWTDTLTPNLINEARLGFTRNVGGNIPVEPVKLSDVGMTRFNSAQYSGIPYIITNDPIPNFGGISTNYDQLSTGNTYTFSDTLAWVHGKHSIRVGFDYRRYQINQFNNFASRGYLSFASFSDFLKGSILSSFVGTGITVRDFRARDIAAYVQDDYKVTKRLTLNLGLRYDYLGPSVDRLDRNGNFDPSLLDAATLASGGAGLAKGFLLPSTFTSSTIQGTPGVDRSTLNSLNPKNFAPRIGFAWDPFGDGKTAIRGGYGIYYVRISNQTLLQLITAAPFFQLSNLSNPAGATLANPFPNLPVASQFPILPQLPQLTGYSATGVPQFSAPLLTLNPIQRNLSTPYAEQYNLSVQRQLPASFTLELAYAGSQGVKLLQSIQENQALLANAIAPIRGLTANSASNVNARVPVVGFSPSGLNEVTSNGHSTYNAFTSTLNRRVGSMFLQAAYTFSKAIDNNSGSATQDLGSTYGNQYITSLARGLSDFDRTHRLQITYDYQLPGYGTGLVRQFLGNWSIGGLTTYQSALPITFSCSTCGTSNVYGQTTAGSLPPSIVGDFSQFSKGGDPRSYLDVGTSAFNTGILAVPPVYTTGQILATNLNALGGGGNQTYTVGSDGTANFTGQLFGTLPRNPGTRGQFQQQWDFNIAKVFQVRENMKLRFDAQFFNLFNHTVFSAPASAVGSSAFGRISSTQTQPRIIQLAGRFQF